MSEATLTRDEEIRQIHEKYRTFYQLGGGLLLVLIGVLIGAVIFSDEPGYGTNIYTELLSVTLTIGVLNVLQERRDNRNRIKDLQDQLVRDAGSPIHATAVSAVDTLRKRGWLGRKKMYNVPDDTESLLEDADLSFADLHNADLSGANLSKASFVEANLTSAYLVETNLSSAKMLEVNLTKAKLDQANLIGADLRLADLSGASLNNADLTDLNSNHSNLMHADFWGAKLTRAHFHGASLISADLWRATLNDANLVTANLTNTNLIGANLTNASLIGANLSGTLFQKSTIFDENTIFPDGSNWSEGRDLAEFGAETREIVSDTLQLGDSDDKIIFTYTFADGTQRRWRYLNGWMDDKDGNPLDEK